MASIRTDQAEGLRRMIAKPAPRVLTFLSSAPGNDKSATLLNLGASLARTGSNVLVVDANVATRGVGAVLDRGKAGTLLQAASAQRSLSDVIRPMQQGLALSVMARRVMSDKERQNMAALFARLAADNDIVVVDADLDGSDMLPLPALADGEIIVQVEDRTESVTAAYSLVKRVTDRYGRRTISILVTGTDISRAGKIYKSIATAARRYLALEIHSIGAVPNDEHLARATRLGRPVIDAFPLADASVAFRDLAGHFSRCGETPGRGNAQSGSPVRI